MVGFQNDGRRKYKSFYAKTQKEVKEKAKAYMNAKAEGLNVDTVYSFGEWADLWFESHKDNISPTTQENYRYTLRILKDSFSHKKLHDIKPIDVENMLKNLRQEGRSISSLAQCRGMLFQILNKAEANDLIRKNPVRFAEKMRYRELPKRKDAFTKEEVAILMEMLPDNKIGWSIRLLLGTGMRSQELLALEPQHIEPDGSCIHIRQAINMIKGTAVIGTPKSRDSYRDIPVPLNIREYAVKLRTTKDKYIWKLRAKDAPYNPSVFRKEFKKALDEIPGVRALTPHCCRHTYVSQMQSLGVDLSTIQSIVGHADIDMTKHYLHVQESIRLDAIDRFSKAFPGNHGEPDVPDENACRVIKFPNVG
ncbi:MAG: site-specific integrase [Clostridia bacterium]|nr:site-specific integrase [Clostridia bacterium]